MNQIEEAIRQHEERCIINIDRRLVSWKWLISVMIGFLATLGSVTWVLASSATEMRIKISEHEKRLIKIEDIYDDVRYIRKVIEQKE